MIAHPYADKFPMLGTEELERLAADIAENGLQIPIVLDADGRILDGRNRWAACEIVGVTPTTVLYEGDDLAAFVLSANVARRHLTTGQQAMSTALVLNDAGRRENGRWKRGALADTGDTGKVSDSEWARALSKAGIILDYAPTLAESVVNGEASLDRVYQDAEMKRDEQRAMDALVAVIQKEEDDARAKLRELAPDYMEALDNGKFVSAASAYAAWESENQREAARIRQEKATADREAAARRDAAASLYNSLAEALSVISGYGNYGSIDKLMADYDVSLLKPRSFAAEFTAENLAKAHKFISMLEEWEAAR